MPKTSSKSCASCRLWGQKYKLAGKTVTCADLGFDSSDSCSNWGAPQASFYTISVREPTLKEVFGNTELREAWVPFQAKITADKEVCYDEKAGKYSAEFSSREAAEDKAAEWSKEPYVQIKHGFVMPISASILDENQRTS